MEIRCEGIGKGGAAMIDVNKLKKVEDCKGRLKEIVGNEGILHLAKEGACPHYIIINPITKEESIWFVPAELNKWLEENFCYYQEGNFTPKYSFLYLNKVLHEPQSVPQELMMIKDLYHLPIDYVRTPPGIYFLCKVC